MLEELKKQVCEANLLLPKYSLVTFTWGNVSGSDRDDGNQALRGGVQQHDTGGHGGGQFGNRRACGWPVQALQQYGHPLGVVPRFPNPGGIVHTHSRWAASFAQAGMGIPAMGTTQGDYFYGEVPCTRKMTPEEIAGNDELERGNVIIETFQEQGIDPAQVPVVLVHSHGPFALGTGPFSAVHNAVVLEEVAFMDFHAMALTPGLPSMQQELLDKHYLRKHGPGAYYGQG